MKKILSWFGGVVLFLSGFCVNAVEVAFTWEEATLKESGAPLLPEEISGYVVAVYLNGVIAHEVTQRNPPITIDIAPGFYAATIKTVDIAGTESTPSTPISVPVVIGVPNPPVNFSASSL